MFILISNKNLQHSQVIFFSEKLLYLSSEFNVILKRVGEIQENQESNKTPLSFIFILITRGEGK